MPADALTALPSAAPAAAAAPDAPDALWASPLLLSLIGCALLLALGAAALALWLRRHARLQPLPTPAVQRWQAGPETTADATQGLPAPIPRVIWTYWHDAQPPLVVQRCIDSWRRLNPQHTVHLLHAGNVRQFLPDLPEALAQLNIAKQTDWMRLALLQRHGGIWLDASIILTRPLDDWLPALQQAQRADFVGFYLDGYTTAPDFPVIESWFLAAPAGNPFIAQWLARFHAAVVEQGTASYLQTLRQQGRFAQYTQNIGEPSYHTIHVVAQEVLHQAVALPPAQPWRLALLRAEDSAYWLHLQARWKRRPLYARLLWAPGDASRWPALVKLRGGERNKLEPWLRRRHWRAGSLAGRFLAD
ncbi:glycosyltransferase family 32 protein [Vandammella animalimorsus]|uniref:Mannosyltransferase n=1 Tax=Vandammella animalimorsus TaxID=2029117 RepID=A0A2A2ABB9_9BURK|nr:capsular polysaccharide synthesis protein [Vandammella animalimorsus]PAT35116.1 mannosyltransferase [Vandammella animalimorsus]